jgi:hypothetical protein
MVTYTPIPYWLSLPWGDVCAWSRTVKQVQDDDRAASERE